MKPHSDFEAWLAAEMVLYGIWLLLPGSSFAATPAFRILATWGPEMAWGAVIALIGAVWLLALCRHWRRLRWALCIVSVGLWAMLSFSFWLSTLLSTASVTYPMLAVAAFWCSLPLSPWGPHE